MRCEDIQRILTNGLGDGRDASADSVPKSGLVDSVAKSDLVNSAPKGGLVVADVADVADGAAEARRHLASCPECAAFATDLAGIQDHARALPRPALPAALDARTRRAIGAALSSAARVAPLPKGMGAVLAILTALTVLAVFPLVWGGEITEPLSFRTAAAIALLLQNGVMLLIAPILFRKFGARAGFPRSES